MQRGSRVDWAIRLMETLGYPGIAIIVFLENLFPPIPSEVVLPFSGFMTTTGTVGFIGVTVAATTGSLLGAVALYALGGMFGRDRVYRFVERYQRYLGVKPEQVSRAESWFENYGSRTVFICRMIPILRSLISIPAGLVRMNVLRFSLYTLCGSLIWNTVLIALGALLGVSWPLVAVWVGHLQTGIGIVIIAVAVILFVRYMKRR